MARWISLPPSEQFQAKMAHATTSAVPYLLNSTVSLNEIVIINDDNLALSHRISEALMNLGEFIRQEIIENNRNLCTYHNLSKHKAPIALICEFECCPNGCCAMEEPTQRTFMEYGWALLLLVIFVFCILFFTIVMFILHFYNKRRDRKFFERAKSRIFYGSTVGSDESALRSGRFDFNKSNISYVSQSIPQIYHYNETMERRTLPQLYPTTTTFKSMF